MRNLIAGLVLALLIIPAAHAADAQYSETRNVTAPAHVLRHVPVQVQDPSGFVVNQLRRNPTGAWNSPTVFALPTARERRVNARIATEVRRHGIAYTPGRFAVGY